MLGIKSGCYLVFTSDVCRMYINIKRKDLINYYINKYIKKYRIKFKNININKKFFI
jgi:hypothetical protein